MSSLTQHHANVPTTDYNSLDEKLGTEVSGCDVLDDYEAEGKEIRDSGNSFFIYTHALHVCRMAGCSCESVEITMAVMAAGAMARCRFSFFLYRRMLTRLQLLCNSQRSGYDGRRRDASAFLSGAY